MAAVPFVTLPLLLFGLLSFLLLPCTVLGDLTLSNDKECGQLTCGFSEFCSQIDGTCKPCSKICNDGHNREEKLCNHHCQDYLHEMRFLRRDENVGYHSERDEIHRLQVLATISLITSLVVFACVVFLIVTLWLNKKTKFNIFKLASQMRKRKEKKIDIGRLRDDLHRPMGMNGGTDISTIRIQDELNEAMTGSRPQMDYTTLTTTFKNYHARSEPETTSSVCTNKSTKVPIPPLGVRLPSEDSTLDFMYDNPALAPSPTLEKEAMAHKNEASKTNSSDT
ncbi:hypothetical protein RUM44_000225 [Polyplax serrata]|uniref:Protein grindelwald n=1 Tax=Polyplax serrata TaxID=468196 RepID=A0ABR1B6C1_POLSC